ncbi:hypothetical protein [Pseudomonas sp. MH10]|uniref:hypothetical protein n=1 Tax=Pseudomonas sp. MH10 TaxID=3048627 RepID=UPI002AC95803|nr:hypothetical protein [Pseudomonas sp. MH10]MEB0043593.1 hypothetical protein [Pseudomonas sp. MH10]WPX63595.1 hypothetical protein RHM59_22410 [Pseudomonas sp. MH10]
MNTSVESSPWAKDALLSKSQLYADEMNRFSPDDWQFGLFSSLGLEFLARAALSNISPVLLADQQNWRNVMFALGKGATSKQFSAVSIGTKEVLGRLTELLPSFTAEIGGFCAKHVERRNIELHTGEAVFLNASTSEWLPRYYRACAVLLASMGRPLSSLIPEAKKAEEMIESLEDASAKAVDQDIKAHAKVWSNKTDHERQVSISQADAWATRQSGHRSQCPACKSTALLQGTPIGTVATTIGDDEVTQRQGILPSSFECVACLLKISGYSKLSACGLGNVFTETSTYSAAEFFDLYTEDELEDAKREARDYEIDNNE